MMYDGRTKLVEKVTAGDVLMGDDGTPRVVQAGSVIRGDTSNDAYQRSFHQPIPSMYRIVSHDRARVEWTCNGEHILVLQIDVPPSEILYQQATNQWTFYQTRQHKDYTLAWSNEGNMFATQHDAIVARDLAMSTHQPIIFECTVDQYMAFAPEIKKRTKMYQPESVQFEAPPTTFVQHLTNILHRSPLDGEVSHWARLVGMSCIQPTGEDHILSQLLAIYGITPSLTYLPHHLLTDSSSVRLALLGGLIDAASGEYHSITHSYQVTLSSHSLINDVVHLCRGLGFTTHPIATVAPTSFSLSFTGSQLHRIPTRHVADNIEVMMAASNKIQNERAAGFDITNIGHGYYYGFTVTGNGRLLMSDFTVTHNTFTMAGIRPKEENGFTKELLGLKPRMIERVYQMKHELRKTHDIQISCYMLEIYLNKLEDVFWKLQTQQKYQGKEKSKWPEPPELKVRVDAKRKVTVDNSVILQFDTAEEMQKFCDDAEMTRRVRKTGLNEESSRSHLIFAIICTATDKKTGKKTTGKLSLVDLAGSEVSTAQQNRVH